MTEKKVVKPEEQEVQQLPTSLKILLYGISGTGKTAAAATLAKVDAIKHVNFMAVESNAMAGLIKGFEIHKIPKELHSKFHVLRIPSGNRKPSHLLNSARTVLMASVDDLAKKQDLQKSSYTRYTEVLKGMQTFIDTSGKDCGTITDWGEDTVVYIDGLTILLELIQQTIIGGKVLLSLPARGILQNMLMQYIRFLTEEVRCHVVLLAHPVRQKSDITGLESIFIATGGQALKDILPSAFTDVVYATTQGNKFYWNTDFPGAITSARNIPLKRNMPQDFSQFDWTPKAEGF